MIRLVSLSLGLVLSAPALAGSVLVLDADRAVKLVVDGQNHFPPQGSTTIVVEGLEAGAHEVGIRPAIGKKVLHAATVEVPDEHRVVRRWHRPEFAQAEPVALDAGSEGRQGKGPEVVTP